MDNAYKLIINDIKKNYEKYQKLTNQKNEEIKSKQISTSDKNQKIFLEKTDIIKESLINFSKAMDESALLSEKNEMKSYVKIALDSQKYIQNLSKKKNNLPFKLNQPIIQLANSTAQIITRSSDQLKQMQKQGKNGGWFWCGSGNKRVDVFRQLLIKFRQYIANWKLLTQIQSKPIYDNYINPEFNEKDFMFIKQTLRNNWPQNIKPPQKPTEIIVEKKVQVIKQVVKYIQSGKPNNLAIANQWIYGINRQLNPMIGVEIYHQEADKMENGAACAFLGMVYEAGVIISKDYNKAVNYYKKAYNLKDPYGTYLYAKSFEKGLLKENLKPNKEDINFAFKVLGIAASELNCPEAMADYGYIFENGHFQSPNQQLFSINKDLKKALSLYQKARNQKSPKASNNLGVFYLNNKFIDQNNPANLIKTQSNVEKNMKLALQFLNESVSRGFATAYYNLGILYQRGEVIQQDLEKAKEYFLQGAMKGDIRCKILYSFYLIDQTAIYRQNFEQQYKLAIRWLQDVINTSTKKEQVEKSYYYLGLYYQYGFGIDPKPKKAVEYYQKAAFIDYPPAINRLGHCYFSGYGVKCQKTIAIGYYKQAAQKGNTDAMVNLGTAYLTGIQNTLDKNPAIAYQYFQSAMKGGNTDAFVHLSQMYENGIYVKRDEKLAKQLLGIAAMKKNQTAIYMLNQRGLPVDQQILLTIETEMLTAPKTINLNERFPYIKDFNKTSWRR